MKKKIYLSCVIVLSCFIWVNFSEAAFTNVDCSNAAHRVILGDGSTELPQVQCEALEAIWTDLDGVNWTDNTNWDTLTTVDSWYGIYLWTGNVEVQNIILTNNNLRGKWPSEMAAFAPSIGVLDLSDNFIEGPATIPASPFLVQLAFENNKLVFSDFESTHAAYWALLHAMYTFAPQKNVDIARGIDVVEGDTLTITPSVEVNPSGNDSYQWYKDGVAIVGATDRVYVSDDVDESDEGVYTYTITNSVVSSLTLQSNAITVTVSADDSGGDGGGDIGGGEGVLTGYLKYNNSKKYDWKEVTLYSSGGTKIAHDKTNGHGKFKFENLKIGKKYCLYSSQKRNITKERYEEKMNAYRNKYEPKNGDDWINKFNHKYVTKMKENEMRYYRVYRNRDCFKMDTENEKHNLELK